MAHQGDGGGSRSDGSDFRNHRGNRSERTGGQGEGTDFGTPGGGHDRYDTEFRGWRTGPGAPQPPGYEQARNQPQRASEGGAGGGAGGHDYTRDYGNGPQGGEPFNYTGRYSDYGGVPYSGYYGPGEWRGSDRSDRPEGAIRSGGEMGRGFVQGAGGDYRGGNNGNYRNYGGSAGQTGAHNHAGRGPRNYQRADERIREDVNEALTEHAGVDATDIDVRVENGEVTLTGTVDSRREKRMAEDAAEQCRGVRDVHNQLRVQQQNEHLQQGRRSSLGADREVPRQTEREMGKGSAGTSAGGKSAGRKNAGRSSGGRSSGSR